VARLFRTGQEFNVQPVNMDVDSNMNNQDLALSLCIDWWTSSRIEFSTPETTQLFGLIHQCLANITNNNTVTMGWVSTSGRWPSISSIQSWSGANCLESQPWHLNVRCVICSMRSYGISTTGHKLKGLHRKVCTYHHPVLVKNITHNLYPSESMQKMAVEWWWQNWL
jgi:hypothetical protein